jgi:cytosine/adenosine deaminase-related metal-dependent hydrolase
MPFGYTAREPEAPVSLVMLGLVACGLNPDVDKDADREPDDTGTADTADSAEDTSDTGGQDTADTGDTALPDRPADTVGPDLPECTPQRGSGDRVALSGVLLLPEGPVAGTLVYDRATGTITCAGESCDTTGAEVICTEGVVSPGLIDAHNHLQYNILPPWQVGPEFSDRYDWRSDGRYWDYRTAYDEVEEPYTCEVMKWAEARELVHGTTSAVGSTGGACINVLIRNLDEAAPASGLDGYDLRYSASTVTDTIDEADGERYRRSLGDGSIDGVLNHVAEGRDGSVRAEITHMIRNGMVGAGQGYVHSTDATTAQLAQMASEGTAIVWSPRSNLALYATTTPVEIAEKLGVPWAIGTDWTWSGSMAPTRELQCADEWLATKGYPLTDAQLWRKATEDSARILGLDGVLGALEVGYKADIAVFAWSRTPYRAVIASEPEDVRLVVVGGKTLYGTTDAVAATAENPDWCETLDVCGESRSVCAKAGTSGDDAQTLAEIEATLTAALSAEAMPSGYEYANVLYPLFTCGEERDACTLAETTGGDLDGDGVADRDDGCRTVYDPLQWDADLDGIGDACDDCPLSAEESACEPNPDDVDADGIANGDDNCPWRGNVAQTDRDGDAKGDSCDACPDQFDDESTPCAITIGAVRDPGDPQHPEQGAVVSVTGVVTATKATHGFFIQDPAATTFGGLYVYDRGASSVSVGQSVQVDGTYIEYYGLTELTSPTVTVLGAASVPAPVEVDACDVATGAPLAEGLEGMLVRVAPASVTDVNPDSPSDYDEFEVNGCLRVDDWLYDALDNPEAGAAWSTIDGVVVYTFGNSKLAPRSAADLAR